MTLKEKFLEIETYDEFNAVREEYENLNWKDTDISNHYLELLRKCNTYKFPPISEGLMIDFFIQNIIYGMLWTMTIFY